MLLKRILFALVVFVSVKSCNDYVVERYNTPQIKWVNFSINESVESYASRCNCDTLFSPEIPLPNYSDFLGHYHVEISFWYQGKSYTLKAKRRSYQITPERKSVILGNQHLVLSKVKAAINSKFLENKRVKAEAFRKMEQELNQKQIEYEQNIRRNNL